MLLEVLLLEDEPLSEDEDSDFAAGVLALLDLRESVA